MTKEELADTVNKLFWDHQVGRQISYDWGTEDIFYCESCAFLGDQEDPSLHAANIVLEYLEEYYKERFNHER